MRKTLSFTILVWGVEKQARATQVQHLSSRSVRAITSSSTPARYLQKSSSPTGKERVSTNSLSSSASSSRIPLNISVALPDLRQQNMTQIVLEQLLQSKKETHCNREISSHESPKHHGYPSVHLVTHHPSEQNHLLRPTSTTLQCLFSPFPLAISCGSQAPATLTHPLHPVGALAGSLPALRTN